MNGFDEKKAYAAQEEEGQKYVWTIKSRIPIMNN